MIDADVHQESITIDQLLPWIEPGIRDYISNSNFTMPGYLFPHPDHLVQQDAIADAAVPGSDYELFRDQYLDELDVDYAIVNGGSIFLASCLPNTQVVAGISIGYNRWLTEEWLPRDARLRGALMVPSQEPELAAQIIRDFGDKPGIVQVTLTFGSTSGYGQPHYHPIFEAAVEMNLRVALHHGAEGSGINAPPGTGYPRYFVEYHALAPIAAMAHTTSLICHGVFEKYPDLGVVISEGGILWLPEVLWRLDADWKGLRVEVPWVKRAPSEILFEQMRFTTHPLEQPSGEGDLAQMLESIDGLEGVLMFATGYPRWDSDSPESVLERVPAAWHDAVMEGNARKFYDLPPSSACAGDNGTG